MGRLTETFWGCSALLAPWWTPERLRNFQSARLRALVQHCWRDVPLYRRRWEATGFDPSTFRGLEDLARVPIIERVDLRDSDPNEVLAHSRPRRNLRKMRTSGSSGAPVNIRRSGFEEWLLRGLRLQSQLIQGDNPLRSRFSIGGSGTRRVWSKLGLTKHARADCLEPMPRILARLLAADPQVVGGYSGSVTALAAALPPQDRARLHLRAVYCGAETMTPPMRDIIRRAFGVGPLTSYASHEFNLIASECAQTGLMHVWGGTVIVEILKDGQPVAEGEQGDTVVTALHSFAMPFIRYRLGDLVTRGPDRCPCGAPFATISEVQGRTIEVFLLPGGRLLHPYAIVRPLVHETNIVRQYQIVQEQCDLIRVRLKGLGEATPEQRLRIEQRIKEVCGPDVRVELEAVDEIRPDANRKYRPYYSLVHRPDIHAQSPG